MHLLLFLLMVLLPTAYTLKCYECIPGVSGACTDTAKECPSQDYWCGALRVLSYTGSSEVGDFSAKICASTEQCFEGSINSGVSRIVVTSQCCRSELCNTLPAPGPSKTKPNGKKCFRCDGKKCTTTLNCEGNEDYCMSTTVDKDGEKTVVKGCASKVMCSSAQTAQITGAVVGELKCCQGDYCNSASGISAGLLLLVAPLTLVMLS